MIPPDWYTSADQKVQVLLRGAAHYVYAGRLSRIQELRLEQNRSTSNEMKTSTEDLGHRRMRRTAEQNRSF